MPFGILDTRYIDFPPNVDATYLQGLRTRAGVDFPRVLREIDSRLGALNSNIDPMLASLITPTTEVYADDTAPSAFEITERAEYTLARPQMTEGSAHMLPIRGYDVALGFTEDGLESMSLPRILSNVDSMFLGWRTRYRKEAMKRLTSDAEVRVAAKTTVTSPGFAGSGSGDNVFNRPYKDGMPLPGGYTHYYAVGGGTLAATLKAARDRLKKWYDGPFDLIAPQSQIDLVAAINPGDPSNGFVSAGTLLVRPPTASAEAQVDNAMYLGVLFGDIRVHKAITDYSDPVLSIYKSFGALNPQNPLAWRYDELKGRNAIIRYRDLYPLSNAVMKQDFGIGVNNRVAVVNVMNSTGSYVPPTIS